MREIKFRGKRIDKEGVYMKEAWLDRKNCDFSATTFKGKWFILYTEEPSGRAAFCLGLI